ncbi:hypothetical protein [Pseudomonas sp. 8 R 14]|nr:hypothetical protein [Pseudomonas sp. 8 R 14]
MLPNLQRRNRYSLDRCRGATEQQRLQRFGMRLQPRLYKLLGQQLQQLPRALGFDSAQHLSPQPRHHPHRTQYTNQQQIDQDLASDLTPQFSHLRRWQQAHPTDHRRQVDKQQRLIAEHQQTIGNRVVAELQQFIKFGLGEVGQQLFAVGLEVRQQVIQLRNVVPHIEEGFSKAAEKRCFQHSAPIEGLGFGIVFPLILESAGPLFTQASLQPRDHRLIRPIQRLDVVLGNVGIEGDPVRLVAITLGDFEEAAGADGLVDRLAQGAAIGIDALQHHRRVADGHEARALEHMHQRQGAIGRARGDGAAGDD